jgi:sugar-specific transcriptional regulator TrmB
MRAGEIRAEAFRRGRNVRRDQIVGVLERLERRGIVRQKAGAWDVIELAQAVAAMAEEDAP